MDDERCGEGEFTYNTGDVYRGRWSEDKQSMSLLSHPHTCTCITMHTPTHSHTHTLTHSHEDGMGELQFASNDIYRGYWKDGIRHGDVSTTNEYVNLLNTIEYYRILYGILLNTIEYYRIL